MPFGQPGGQGFQNPVNNRIIVVAPGKNQGIFVYSPSAGAGDLAVSIAAVSGTDQYGNAYKGPGIEVQGSGDVGQTIFLGLIAGIAELQMPTGVSWEGTPANLFTTAVGSGATEFISAGLSGPQLNIASHTDWVQISLLSPNEGGTSTASGSLRYIDSTGSVHVVLAWGANGIQGSIPFASSSAPSGTTGEAQLYSANGQLAFVNPQGLQGNISSCGLANVTPTTVTAAALTQISAGFSIPANDMEGGSVYRLSASGVGTQGTTAQTLEFLIQIGTHNTGIIVPTANLPISALFRWDCVGTLVCLATGSSGNTVFIRINLTITDVTTIGSGTSTSWCVQGLGAQAVDTTVGQGVAIYCGWGSTVGAPTVTCQYSYMERVC